ncbi:SAF domain-containing protein [Nonomuraea sp. NBC_00507]|uniref:SAF domain-containing protein n=1 Tax=Nonomuraea sp. NBC_00507 TaxID=2976002 RepID=UPI002E19CBEB
MIALAIALIALGALLAAYLVTSLDTRASVLVAARNIAIGEQLGQADLTEAKISAEPGIATVPSRQLQQLVGRVAAVDLPKGSLLGPASVTTQLSPKRGEALVPVAFKPSQLPARGLRTGDRVQMIVVPDPARPPQNGDGQAVSDQDPSLTDAPLSAVVDRVGASNATDGLVVVDLIMAESGGPQMAKQAAAGRIALVLTSRRTR